MTQGSPFDRWQRSFRSEKTKYNWTKLADQYRQWRTMTWEDLLEERRKTFYPDRELPLDEQAVIKKTVEEKVKEWLRLVEKHGYAPATVRQHLKAIKSFYKEASFDTMELSLKSLRLPKGTVIDSLPPTAEEIAKLLTFGSLRERALVAFLAETGWGPELLARSDIDWVDKSQGKPYIVVTKRGKTGEHVTTFVGQRAANLLDAYIQARGDTEARPESPLFTNHRGKRFVPKRINETVVRLAEKSGLNRKLYRGRNSFHAYALRHFFQTTLEDAKVPDLWIKQMMGHALKEQEKYSQPRILQMRQAYIAAYDKLIGRPTTLPAPQITPDVVTKILTALQAVASASNDPAIKQNVEEIVSGIRGKNDAT